MHTNLHTQTTPRPHPLRARRLRGALLGVVALAVLGFAACEPPPQKVFCNGYVATIVGTTGNDSINGTDGKDVIAGLGGNDTISGLGGADVICGGSGTDTVSGGSGEDVLTGGPGSDSLAGGTERDLVDYQYSTAGIVVDLKAGRGGEADTISAIEDVIGTHYADHLTGDEGPNTLIGIDGSDTMIGLGGNDELGGLDSPGATNYYYGGPGDDLVLGGSDHDIVAYDGSSATTVFVDLGGEVARGEGTDTLEQVEGAIGTAGNDTMYGGPGANTLDAGEGDDVVDGRGGNDVVDGGPGSDRGTWSTSTTGVVVNLGSGQATGQGSDTLSHIEHITGSSHDDLLTGTASANVIDGSDGIDFCVGGGGTDTFIRCE